MRGSFTGYTLDSKKIFSAKKKKNAGQATPTSANTSSWYTCARHKGFPTEYSICNKTCIYIIRTDFFLFRHFLCSFPPFYTFFAPAFPFPSFTSVGCVSQVTWYAVLRADWSLLH